MWATSIGSTLAQRPVSGVRKSGIPDGTETPAPVSTTVQAEPRIRLARRLTPTGFRLSASALTIFELQGPDPSRFCPLVATGLYNYRPQHRRDVVGGIGGNRAKT